jgi:hypothetical protein
MELNEGQKALLTLATMTTIGFGEQTQEDRIALEGAGLIESCGPNTYQATPKGHEYEKTNGALG